MRTTSLGGQTAAPALVMVGERDVVHPPATTRLTAERIGGELQVLEGMSHWLPGEPGWRDVADQALGWMKAQAGAAA